MAEVQQKMDSETPAMTEKSIVESTPVEKPTTESKPEAIASTDMAESIPAAGTETMTTEEAAKTEPATEEGILGYKAPGLVKSFRFSKKIFWFSDAPIESQTVSSYLRNEKPEIAYSTAAYASQTGKGLLFFAKRVEDKSHPAGILNLSEVSDILKDGPTEFSFKLNGHKHTFQAANQKERDSWLAAVESKAADAKAGRDEIVEGEGYKSRLSTLTKSGLATSAVAAAGKPMSAMTPKATEDKVHDGTKEGDAVVASSSAEAAATKPMDAKSRSQSRKRQSIFGKVLGKKEEHDEKKEMKKEDKAEEKIEKKAETADAVEPAAMDASAIASRVVTEPVVPAEENKATETGDMTTDAAEAPAATTSPEAAPKPTKRGSVFGNFFNKKDSMSPSREKKEKDFVPAVPAKDAETAPLGETQEAAALPQAEEITAMSTPTEDTPAPTSTIPATTSESKGGLFGFLKQKEAQREEKKEMKAEDKMEKKVEGPATDAETPAVATIESMALSTATAAGTATTPEATKEKRRQSFFGTLSGKKEKKTDATSDAEMTDGEKKSAAGKLGGLFRKASRTAKPTPSTVTDSSVPPAIPKDAETSAETDPKIEPTTESAPVPMTNGAMEKAPEPAMVGESGPTAVAASA